MKNDEKSSSSFIGVDSEQPCVGTQMKNDTKFELEKYISYFDKYINHDKSQKFLRI